MEIKIMIYWAALFYLLLGGHRVQPMSEDTHIGTLSPL